MCSDMSSVSAGWRSRKASVDTRHWKLHSIFKLPLQARSNAPHTVPSLSHVPHDLSQTEALCLYFFTFSLQPPALIVNFISSNPRLAFICNNWHAAAVKYRRYADCTRERERIIQSSRITLSVPMSLVCCAYMFTYSICMLGCLIVM